MKDEQEPDYEYDLPIEPPDDVIEELAEDFPGDSFLIDEDLSNETDTDIPANDLDRVTKPKAQASAVIDKPFVSDAVETLPNHLPKLASASDLLAQEDMPIEWLLEEIIPQGNIVLLAAPPSSYKTYLALAIGLAVAEGKPFLGRKTKKTQVIYLDKENPKLVLKERFKQLGGSSNFLIWPRWEEEPPNVGKKFKGSNFKYTDLIDKPSLLIFDSLVRFHAADENSATEMAKIMNTFRELCDEGKGDLTLLIIHHAGKKITSTYRGTSEILGGVDLAYTIKADNKKDAVTLECVKNRLIKEGTIDIKVEAAGDSLRFIDFTLENEKIKERAMESRLKEISGLLGKYIKENNNQKPNSGTFKKWIKDNMDLSPKLINECLKNGTGKYWKKEIGSDNAKLFNPIID